MKTLPLRSSFNRPSDGAALIIVLAFIVLLAGMVVAMLSRTSTDRQLARGSFNETKADQLARSALDVVVGDLKQEIVNGSATPAPSVNGYTIYTPTSAAKMLPVRSGNPSGSPDPIPNLVRRSVYSDAASRASNTNSTVDSLNGRSISPRQWNKHYLIPRSTASPTPSPTDTTPISSFTAPDWIFTTSAGPTVIAAPSTTVVGRYAYAIYDEGGLIDVNVGGYPPPSTLPSPPTYIQSIARKGSVAFADLTPLGMSTSGAGDIVGWRNYATIQPGGSFSLFTFDPSALARYVTAVLSNTNGFMTVTGTTWAGSGAGSGTDQMFLNRQSLIQFRRSSVFPANTLQYLGTFSREYNRATWKPATPTAINPNLTTVRVTAAFSRLDGTSAVIGEPLLKTRFPLGRLSWLTYKGPSALRNFPPASPALPVTDPDYDMWQLLYTYNVPQSYLQQGTAANIKKAFGLVWDNSTTTANVGSQWVYTSFSSAHSGGTFDGTSGNGATVIKTLTTVQSEAREPDFFEILQAVILNGSVGLGSSGAGGARTFINADQNYWDTTNGRSADYQILQIGANIIDEYDTDNLPTFLNYGVNQGAAGFARRSMGIENIPYLSKLVFAPYFTNHGQGDQFYAWLVPSLWNPHQNGGYAAGEVRFAMTSGSMTATIVDNKGNKFTSGPVTGSSAAPYIQVLANTFALPYPPALTPINNITATSGAPTVSETFNAGTNYYGLFFPFTYPDPNNITDKTADQAYPSFGANTNFEMQINVGSSGSPVWRPYQRWLGCTQSATPLACIDPKGAGGWKNNKLMDPEFVSIDPRTVRFGVWGSDANDTGKKKGDFQDGAEDSLDQSSALELINAFKPQPASSFPSTGTAYHRYAANSVAGDRYSDLDGVVRQGDWASDAVGTGSHRTVMYGPTTTDREPFLSAPFHSVAELGEVFRDQPWKTLNFTISNSADAGLLDAFTLQEVPVTAGRTSLNTRQSPVLAAILSQGGLRINGSRIITSPDANAVASAIVGITAANPLISKANLVAQLAADASFTGLGNKEARECVMRSLTDAGQTRTWTLMIDVIAQSGRYPPSATNLSQFVVEGEKRYWLHIAIDRFTGEVIDQQLEAVYE